jgi:hypothetical protein
MSPWLTRPVDVCAAMSAVKPLATPTGSGCATASIAASITVPCSLPRAIFSEDQVTISGETRDYQGRHFCPACGSSAFTRYADEIEIHLGALDQPDQFMPTYESWVIRREAWLPAFPLARHYQRDRESVGQADIPPRA